MNMLFSLLLILTLQITFIRCNVNDPDSVCYPDNWNCDPNLHECVVNPLNEDIAICFCTDKDNCDSPSINVDTACPDATLMLDVCGPNGTCQNEATGVHGYCACDPNWSGPRCQNETQVPDKGDGGGHGGHGGHSDRYNDYKPQHTRYDPNLKIYVPVYYDANSFDPNDDFVNRTFLDYFSDTAIYRSCDNEGITCNPSYPYRSLDGTCNNLNNPIWGATETAQMRFLDPQFETGTNTSDNIPRENGLPSAREVSNEVFDSTHNQHFSTKHSITMVWFGQFVAHDIALSKTHEEPTDCCNETNHGDPRCLKISVPNWDRYYKFHCLHFVRSLVTTRGCVPDPGWNNTVDLYQEINNFQSHFIDLSQVYANTVNESLELRELVGGRLKVKEGAEGEDLLPENNAPGCPMTQNDSYCQLTGDPRVDDVPYLGASHLLMVRAHNFIAKELAALNNTGWDDEILFQESRKILIALFQHFVYKEYLPELLGVNLANNNLLGINATGFQDDYNDTSNPGIFNEFIGAAMRMGHSMIPPHQAYLMPGHCLMDWYTAIETFKSSQILYAHGGANLTEYARWMTWDKSMKNNRFIEDEFRNWLFGGEDLGARNVQRGRDHGIANYNAFRQFCGFDPVSFDDYIMMDHDWDSSEKLRTLYRYVDDIDLFAGGLSESPRGGSLLGPTFTCLFIKQFRKIRISDRMFYERPGMFTEDQLNSIKKMTLSKLVCDNYNLPTVQPNLFQMGYYNNQNPLVNCTSLDSLDFSLWSI